MANDQQQSTEAFRQWKPVCSVAEGTYELANQLSIELSDLDQHPIHIYIYTKVSIEMYAFFDEIPIWKLPFQYISPVNVMLSRNNLHRN